MPGVTLKVQQIEQLGVPYPISRPSSREVRIRVPTLFLSSILVGEPSQPKKGGERALGDLAFEGQHDHGKHFPHGMMHASPTQLQAPPWQRYFGTHTCAFGPSSVSV